jgi:hypothetical protein
MNDLVDTTRRDADVPGQAILGQPQGAKELFQEDLPGVNRRQLLRSHPSSSVVNWFPFNPIGAKAAS